MKVRTIFSVLILCLFFFSCQKENVLIEPDEIGNSKQTEIEKLLLAHGYKKMDAADNRNAKQGKRIDNYNELQKYLSAQEKSLVLKAEPIIPNGQNLRDPTDPPEWNEGFLADSSYNGEHTEGVHDYIFPFLEGTFPSHLSIIFDASSGTPSEITWTFDLFSSSPAVWTWEHYYLGGNVFAFLTLQGGFTSTIVSGTNTYIKQWGVLFTKTYDSAILYITATPE